MPDDRFEDPLFRDALFRQKRKHGRFRLVAPPRLERPAADTHAHVHLLPDPALAFAQCAVCGVSFVCDVIDVCEDDLAVFGRFDGWLAQAAGLVGALEGASRAVVAAGGDALTGLPAGAEPQGLLPAGAACGAAGGAGAANGAGAASGAGAARGADGADAAGAAGGVHAAGTANAAGVPHLRLAVGCHPHNAAAFDAAAEARLLALLADPRVCAVGEIGLDYHYDFSPRDAQREAFRRQIRIAHATGLPVALHIREAHDEALAILREEGFPKGGTLLHCFDLDGSALQPWLEAGCFVALGGALTFSRCEGTRHAVAAAPLERLLTETDSPYMAPEPMRGMTCTPAHVVFTAARMAEVRGREPGPQRAALLDALMENARGLLDRPPTPWQLEHAAAPAAAPAATRAAAAPAAPAAGGEACA